MKLELLQNTKNIVIYGGKKEMRLLLTYFFYIKNLRLDLVTA